MISCLAGFKLLLEQKSLTDAFWKNLDSSFIYTAINILTFKVHLKEKSSVNQSVVSGH